MTYQNKVANIGDDSPSFTILLITGFIELYCSYKDIEYPCSNKLWMNKKQLISKVKLGL